VFGVFGVFGKLITEQVTAPLDGPYNVGKCSESGNRRSVDALALRESSAKQQCICRRQMLNLPRHHRNEHINFKEMLAVLKAIELWGPQLSGRSLHLAIDNTAVVHVITKKSIKGQAMAPLRFLLLEAARWDLDLISHWISTGENGLADALHEWRKLANMAPQLTQKALSRPLKQMIPNTTSPETHRSPGTTTKQALTAKQPAAYGGASAASHAELMERQDAAMPSGAACTALSGPSPQTL
jgi:hypothetical protein